MIGTDDNVYRRFGITNCVKFRVEEKCVEPAGTSERSVPKHHTTGRYIPEAEVKRQTYFTYVSCNYEVHTKI